MKVALDSLSTLDGELKKIENQVNNKVNYESEWSYSQLVSRKGREKNTILTCQIGKIP